MSIGTVLFSPRTDSTLREFVITLSGTPVEQNGNAQPIGAGAQTVTIKPDPFVYTVNTFDGTISAFAIAPATGVLTPVPGSPLPAGTTPKRMVVVSNTFAYVVGGGSNTGTVTAFTITPTTGGLTQVGAPLPCGSFPDSLVADPTGQFLYVSTGHGFSITPTTGALTPLPGSPFSGLGRPLAMDPGGKFLYGGGGGIQVSAIGTNGVPRPVPGTPFLVSTSFFNTILVHPSGQFVYAPHTSPANPQGEIVAARVSPTGTLTAVPGSPFTGGGMNGPIGGIVEPDGKFLYINSPIFTTALSGFAIDPATGALTPLAGSPFPAQGLLDLAAIKFP